MSDLTRIYRAKTGFRALAWAGAVLVAFAGFLAVLYLIEPTKIERIFSSIPPAVLLVIWFGGIGFAAFAMAGHRPAVRLRRWLLRRGGEA